MSCYCTFATVKAGWFTGFTGISHTYNLDLVFRKHVSGVWLKLRKGTITASEYGECCQDWQSHLCQISVWPPLKMINKLWSRFLFLIQSHHLVQRYSWTRYNWIEKGRSSHSQSHYREVPRWEIFMEQEFRFRLYFWLFGNTKKKDLGQLWATF